MSHQLYDTVRVKTKGETDLLVLLTKKRNKEKLDSRLSEKQQQQYTHSLGDVNPTSVIYGNRY